MSKTSIVLAIAALATALGWQVERVAHVKTQAAHSAYVAQAEAQARRLTERVLETTSELQNAQNTHDAEASKEIAATGRKRLAGDAAALRVRNAAREVAEVAARGCEDPDAPELRQAAADAIRLLADLRDRADEAAGQLARAADDAHFAGIACERRYSEVEAILKSASQDANR